MEFYLPCYTSYIVEKLSVLLPVKLYIRVCGRQDFTTMLNKMATLSFATVLNKRVTNPRIQFSTWNHAPAFLP